MAATAGNGTGIAGVANSDNIKIMALKILDAEGYGYGMEAIGAYNYIYKAQQLGVNVVAINNSWGGVGEESYILEELINLVGANGAISVCAAGNSSEDNDTVEALPSNIDSPYVIAVAASNENDELATFSSYGANNVDIAAPGTDILSTVSYTCFNPGIYNNPNELCSLMEDFSDGELVQTINNKGYINTDKTEDSTDTDEDSETSLSGTYIDDNNYRDHFSSSIGEVAEGDTRAVSIMICPAADGDFVVNLDNFGISKSGVSEEEFGKYDFYNGTSMATPYVTGAVAAIANVYTDESILGIKSRVLGSTRKTESLQGKVSTGGVLDLSKLQNPNMSIESAYLNEENQIVISGFYLDGAPVKINDKEVKATEVVYGDEKLWTVLTIDAGFSEDTALICYDEETGWTKVASLPASLDNASGYTLAAFNGNIYLLGGYTDGTCSTSVFEYDSETNEWKAAPALPEGRAYTKALQSGNQLVVTLGGNDNGVAGTNLIFDGTKWSTSKTNIGTVCDVETITFAETSIDIATAQIGIVKDGLVYTNCLVENLGDTFIYNVSKDTYESTGYRLDKDSLYYDHLVATTVQDELYVLFGFEEVQYYEDWMARKKKALSEYEYEEEEDDIYSCDSYI